MQSPAASALQAELHRSSGLQTAQAIRMTRASELGSSADETNGGAAVPKGAHGRFLAFGVGMTEVNALQIR